MRDRLLKTWLVVRRWSIAATPLLLLALAQCGGNGGAGSGYGY